MRTLLLSIFFLMTFVISATAQSSYKIGTSFSSFVDYQKTFSRPDESFRRKEDTLQKQFEAKKLKWPANYIYMRSFKYDSQLEVWVKDQIKDAFKLFKTYKVCALAGTLGPKRLEGDYQVPEVGSNLGINDLLTASDRSFRIQSGQRLHTIERERCEMGASDMNARWAGVERPYTQADVERIRGRFHVEHTLARLGAERLWKLLHSEDYVAALGALTGAQAVQMVKAGLNAIYLSGWQVAADANLSGHTYPDQSLYPANSAPALVKRLTARSFAPTRSTPPKARTARTGSPRSSLTPRPGSAARSTRSS